MLRTCLKKIDRHKEKFCWYVLRPQPVKNPSREFSGVFPRSYVYSAIHVLIFTDVHRRVPLHFEQSNGRRAIGREFSASPTLKAGSERIFLAFPLAASVTRLRLKYLLVDFTTMGSSCHHRRLPSSDRSPRPIDSSCNFFLPERLYFESFENSSSLKTRFTSTFSSFAKIDLYLPLNLTSFKTIYGNLLNNVHRVLLSVQNFVRFIICDGIGARIAFNIMFTNRTHLFETSFVGTLSLFSSI